MPKTASKPIPTYVTLLLDESGSMQSCLDQTISGFNEYFDSLHSQKDQKYIYNVLTFNSHTGVKALFENTGLKPHLEYINYMPAATTPLLDAIGEGVKVAEKYLEKSEEERNTIFIIMTDGEENASKEYKKETIKKLIEKKEKEGWTFVYLGANQDAFQEAGSLGFQHGNIANYQTVETQSTFQSVARSTVGYSTMAGGQSTGNVGNFLSDPKEPNGK